MEEQTPKKEGEIPTPQGMSEQDSALNDADQQKAEKPETEAKPVEVKFAERILGREFETVEEAEKAISNLKSFVGDQTVAKQRKALETLAQKSNLSMEELMEVIETQDLPAPENQTQPQEVPMNLPDDTTKRVVRIETDSFVKDVPEAKAVRDVLFAEALATGKSVQDIWASKYAPIVEEGKKLGAKKLQATIEGQPIKPSSAEGGDTKTKIDFSKMSSRDMEEYLGYRPPSQKL